jgi:hypothetical protein
MSLTIHCYEPQSTPRQTSLVLTEPRPFAIYALQDTLSEDARELRSTILRRIEENPPANATLLFELEVRASRPGELPTLRVIKVGGRAMIELIRPESRGRVTKGTDLKSGLRFEATLRDLRTISFSLEIESEAVAKAGMGSSRPSGSKAVESLGSLLWIVPNIVEVITAPTGKIIAWLANRARKMGFSPGMVSPLILMSGFMLGAGYVAYDQYKTGMDAQERLAALQIDYDNSLLARDAAVTAEQTCREQRVDLTHMLNDIEETRRLQAEIALAKPLSHAVAIEAGGPRMAAEAAMEFDKPAWDSLHKLVVSEMTGQKEPKSLAPICLAQEEKLGQDLPRFMLVWHPSADFTCPEGFGAVIDAVDMAGPWGLSTRVAKEFGSLADSAGDPRSNERWAAATYTTGLRTVMETLLQADTDDRPPVAPGQVHVWTLALFDAYNRMPSPAGGAMDRPMESCLTDLIAEVAQRYQPAEPGQPVMPPIAAIAGGEELRITPTSGCPWPAGVLNQGAAAAVRAVTQMGLIQQVVDAGEVAEEG